jgi:plasmid maintenance system antidote protein VapI
MKLRDWLYWERITIKAFAKVLGCSREHLVGVMSGKRNFSLELAEKILVITKNKVKKKDISD